MQKFVSDLRVRLLNRFNLLSFGVSICDFEQVIPTEMFQLLILKFILLISLNNILENCQTRYKKMFLKVSTTELKRIVPLIRKKLLELRSCMTNRVESNLKFCKLYSNQLVKSIPLDTLQEKIFFWHRLVQIIRE